MTRKKATLKKKKKELYAYDSNITYLRISHVILDVQMAAPEPAPLASVTSIGVHSISSAV